MKTAKLFFATALFGAFLTGCKDDSAIEDAVNGTGDYLISETYVNSSLVGTFSYDNKNQLVEGKLYDEAGTLTATTSYTYNNSKGRLVSYAAYSGQETILTELEYDNSGRISTSRILHNSELTSVLQYEYDGNKIIMNDIVDDGIHRQHIYTKEGNNIVKEEARYPDLPQANWTKEYSDFDDKINHSGTMNSLIYFIPANNPRNEKLTSAIGTIDYEWEWRYTYNEAGYVTSATSYDKTSGEMVDQMEYKYIRAN